MEVERYRPYPAYKASGVEWVGDIPNEWDVRPLFGAADTESRKNENGQESTVLSLSYGNIVIRDVESNHGLLPASFNTYQLVEAGEVILRLTDLQNDKRSLRVGHAKIKGVITSAYLKLIAKPEILDDYFFYRQLHSYDTTKVFYGMGGGLRQSMKFEEMRRLPILIPPLTEQIQIAAFLDFETAQIDTLIAKQQRLIELLEEKRQAVISHAVTKGLDPTAPLHPSGLEWLGDVPAHWEVKRIKRFSMLHRGYDLTNMERTEGKVPVVTSGGLNGTHGKAMVEGPGIVTGRYGSTGRIFYIEEAFWPHNTTLFVSNFFGNFRKFVWYSLKTVDFASHSAKAAVPGIDRNDIHALPIVVPTIEDQREIVRFLDNRMVKFKTLMDKARSGIELLKERRTALISAAVTGKIDVRDWLAPTDVDVKLSELETS